jgi:hypothetical protein
MASEQVMALYVGTTETCNTLLSSQFLYDLTFHFLPHGWTQFINYTGLRAGGGQHNCVMWGYIHRLQHVDGYVTWHTGKWVLLERQHCGTL